MDHALVRGTVVDLRNSFSALAAGALVEPGIEWLIPEEPATQLPEDTPVLAGISAGGDAVLVEIALASDGLMRTDSPQDVPGDVVPAPQLFGTEPLLAAHDMTHAETQEALREMFAAEANVCDAPTRVDHGFAYWGTQQLVFVAGGADVETGELLESLCFFRLSDDSSGPWPLEGDVRPQRVLAMAVDYTRGALLIFDRLRRPPSARGAGGGRDRGRLLRVELSTGHISQIAEWRARLDDTRFGLATTPRGVFWLVTSDERTGRFRVLRYRLTDDGDLIHGGSAFGDGLMVDGPTATGRGVSLLVERRNGRVEPVSVDVRALTPGRPHLLHTDF